MCVLIISNSAKRSSPETFHKYCVILFVPNILLMSGLEALAVIGGIGASAQLLQHATSIISWIISGSSGRQLSVDPSDLELRFQLLAELQKLNDNLNAHHSDFLITAMDSISCELHELQNLMSSESSLRHGTKRNRASYMFKQPQRMKRMRHRIINLDKRLGLIYKVLHIRHLSQNPLRRDPIQLAKSSQRK
jgi:hypothetical protein